MRSKAFFLLAAVGCGSTTRPPANPPPPDPTPDAGIVETTGPVKPVPPPAPKPLVELPVEYHKLDNGLRVVLSRDPSVPIVTVAVYYGIGFRVEPKNRTGFAHLFEHMMFEGSKNLPKGTHDKLVMGNGGVMNGSTRFDFTNYYETVPSHMLEPILWAEADRMRGLEITDANLKNQQGVVANEVRVNVLNRPYGGFPWLDLPQVANTNWYNAHNFYGALEDLQAATLADVKAFFNQYYTPSNAVVAIVGDFDTAEALAFVKKHFEGIPAGTRPALPDISEPRQTAERRTTKVDKQADRPALALAWHMPERGTPHFWAAAYLLQALTTGKDSLLYQSLVQKHGYTGDVTGAINEIGHQFNYRGPMLFSLSLFHDKTTPADKILAAIDEEIARLAATPLDAATFTRVQTKVRASYYEVIDDTFGRADLLASTALFDDDPARVNKIELELLKVTPADVQAAAREVLRKDNRTVLILEAGKEVK
jgi:zinc protease